MLAMVLPRGGLPARGARVGGCAGGVWVGARLVCGWCVCGVFSLSTLSNST